MTSFVDGSATERQFSSLGTKIAVSYAIVSGKNSKLGHRKFNLCQKNSIQTGSITLLSV